MKNFKTPEEMVKEWEEHQESLLQPRIILNRIKTPDGTILTSYHRHDFVEYKDKNGLIYMVDGGLDYLRRSVHEDHPYEELSITDSAPFEQIRESLHWGTYGKSGKGPLKWIPLCEMEDEHLQKIISTQKQVPKWFLSYMKNELNYRKSNKKENK